MQSVNEILTEWAAGTEHTAVQGLITDLLPDRPQTNIIVLASRPGVEPSKRSWNDNTCVTRAFQQEALESHNRPRWGLYAEERDITHRYGC